MRRFAMVVFAAGCQAIFPLTEPPPDADPRMKCNEQPLVCPADYLSIAGSSSFYKPSTIDGQPWLLAAASCVADQPGAPNGFTHLAVPDDQVELTAINVAIADTTRWLGIRRDSLGGPFTTVTMQSGFPPQSGSPWAPGHPGSGMACVAYTPPLGELISLDCNNETHQFVCECDCNNQRD